MTRADEATPWAEAHEDAADETTALGVADGRSIDGNVLDAYSRVVTSVARALGPSVASLRIHRRSGQGVATGAGSGVVITPDGFLLTSAHVVASGAAGTASFADGRELDFEVVGADPLSDLAVVRVALGAGNAAL
jgi:S1-C subfamily serine protease